MSIERRTFLKGVGSLAATASVGSLAFSKERKSSVGVVGGGIVGASIAMHLAQAGANVMLFEKTAPATGATGKSFAWINAFSNNPHYRALRLKSIAAYHQLDGQLNLEVIWGGAIHWAINLAEAERMKANVLEFDQAGYPARLIVPADLAELAPNLRLGSVDAAFFASLDGHLDPVAVTQKFLEQAEEHLANVVYPCEVTALLLSEGKFFGSRDDPRRLSVGSASSSPVV